MQHLSFDDMKRYISEEELTEEYLCWMEPVLLHLENCDSCRKLVDRLMFMEDVCEATDTVITLATKETAIRREYVASHLELMGKVELASRFREGKLKSYFVEMKNGMLQKIQPINEAFSKKNWGETIRFEDGKLVITIMCGPTRNVSVIYVRTDEVKKPIQKQGIWSLKKQAVVVEIPLPKQAKLAEERKAKETKDKAAREKMEAVREKNEREYAKDISAVRNMTEDIVEQYEVYIDME